MHINLTLLCYIVPITTKLNISDTALIVFMVTLVPNTTTLLLVMKLQGQVLKTNTGVSKSTHRRNPHLSTLVWKKKENICFHLFRKCDHSIIFSILHHHQLEWCFQSGHSGEKTKGESAIHQPPPCLPLNLSSSPPQSSFSTNSNSNPQPWHLSCHHHHSPFPPTQCHPQHFRRL